jgi:transcriptional regulator with XRE-family HTH domain
MRTKNSPLGIFLLEVMRHKKRLPSQLASDLNISHATIGRWLSGQDIPNVKSCRKLSEYTGISLERILVITGHLPDIENRENRRSIRSLLKNLK